MKNQEQIQKLEQEWLENPRWNGMVPTAEKWNETDYKLAYNKFKERFSNAGDFEFFFVGKMLCNMSSKFAKCVFNVINAAFVTNIIVKIINE